MAFNEYRNSHKDFEVQELDIERFAYDVFAYTLPLCGLPSSKVPTTTLKENSYIEDDFIKNVGLSVLPIALYMRDDWKTDLEISFEANEFNNILGIARFLEKTLMNCSDYEDEDTLSKIQFSMALCNEMFLFYHYKSIKTFFGVLPRTWSQFCSKLIRECDDFDEPLASALTMHPDVTETWITNFIGKEAIPYGKYKGVSELFCVYSMGNECMDDLAGNITEEESVVQQFDVLNERSDLNLPERFNTRSKLVSRTVDNLSSEEKFQSSEEKALDLTTHKRRKNGSTHVLHKYLKRRKRSRSLKLDIGGFEDAIKKMSLEKENFSPEKPSTKRQRKNF